MVDYIAFFAAIKHSPETETFLIESLKSYDIGSYLVVRETVVNAHKLTNGDHYHFLVQMTNDDYIRYRKRVFLDHFKLKGRATKECGRQYGKVNYLKDPDRMAVYMVKDHGDGDPVVATTFSEAQLTSWFEKSFKKSEQKGYKDSLKVYVDDNLEIDQLKDDEWCIFNKICILQIEFNRVISRASRDENPLGGMRNCLTKAQLTNFANWYMLYHMPINYGADNTKDKISAKAMAWFILNKMI